MMIISFVRGILSSENLIDGPYYIYASIYISAVANLSLSYEVTNQLLS